MQSGPCIGCGATNYAASFGGPMMCPACDCGYPPHVGNPAIVWTGMKIHCDRNDVIQECLDQQPSTAENPNEDSYQRGRFDGIMEFMTAIRTLFDGTDVTNGER